MKLSWKLLSLLVSLVVISCGDDDPSAPSNPCGSPLTGVGSNAFVLDGGSFQNRTIDRDSAISQKLTQVEGDVAGVIIVHVFDALIGTDTAWVTMAVRIPGYQAGSYSWKDLASGTGNSGVSVAIDRNGNRHLLNAVTGTTTVTRFKVATDSAYIDGTFCGTVKDSTGATVSIRGAFMVE